MIQIFICEDNEQQRELVKGYVANYIMIEDLDMEISLATADPNEVLSFVNSEDYLGEGLFFLDVDLNAEITGIVLGSQIRKADRQATIVYITTHSEMTYLTFVYKVEALDYIFKDDIAGLQKRIIECINIVQEKAMNEFSSKRPKLNQKYGDKVISVYYDEIMFIESSSNMHKLIMHCENRQIEFYGKLKDFEELHESFYRCHNSYIVNKDNVVEVDKKNKSIHLSNGETCYASVRLVKGLLN